MRGLCVLVLLFLGCFECFSQANLIDSIREDIQEIDKENIEKLELVFEMYKQFDKQTRYDSMEYYKRVGEELANEIDNNEAFAYVKAMDGAYYYKKRQHLESISSFKEIDFLLDSSNNPVLREYVYMCIGRNYFVLGMPVKDFDSCLLYYRKAMNLEEVVSNEKTAKTYASIIHVYSILGIKDSAVVYCDKLLKLYNQTKENRILNFYYTSKFDFYRGDKDSVLKYKRLIFENLLTFKSSSLEYKSLLNNQYYKMGVSFNSFKEIDSAIVYFYKCITLSQSIKDINCFRYSLSSLSSLLEKNDRIEELTKLNQESLGFAFSIGDTALIARSKLGMSYAYAHTKDYEKSIAINKDLLDNYLHVFSGDYEGILNSNLCYYYSENKDYKNAVKYGQISLDNKNVSATSLYNLADAYLAAYKDSSINKKGILPPILKSEWGESELNEKSAKKEVLILIKKYYEESEKILLKKGDNENLVHPYLGLGDYYDVLGVDNKVLYYYELAWEYSKGYNVSYKDKMRVSRRLYSLYKENRKIVKALFWLETTDSLDRLQHKSNNLQELGKIQAEFEYHQKIYTDSLEQIQVDLKITHQQEQQALKLKSEEEKKYFLYGGILLLIIFLLILYRRFYLAVEQKNVIESQKESIEKKKKQLRKTHQDVQDSINYSSRIQKSIFPSKHLLLKLYPKSFIFFKPKDVVSGDFYWYTNVGEKRVFVTADCTGHGVPGAFMTIIGINIIKEIIQEGIIKSDQVLFEINKRLIEGLRQYGETTIKDGMDIALCIIDSKTIEFVGAHLSLYHVRHGELNEYKGSNIFLGRDFNMQEPKVHYIPFQKNDVIYMSTDGFSDQKGGDKGKKFYSKRLKEFLLSNSDLTMEAQKEKLEELRIKWLKNEYEQLDDMTIVGVKL